MGENRRYMGGDTYLGGDIWVEIPMRKYMDGDT